MTHNNSLQPRGNDADRSRGDIFSLRDAMNRLFDEGMWDPFYELRPIASDATRRALYPKVDVEEDDQNVTVKANIPGMDPKGVEINVEENVVSLSGEISREDTKEDAQKQYYHYEREHGEFRRDVPLPANVSPENAKATSKDGVLTITLPKATQDTRTKVEVETE